VTQGVVLLLFVYSSHYFLVFDVRTPPSAVAAFCDSGAVYKCRDLLTYLICKRILNFTVHLLPQVGLPYLLMRHKGISVSRKSKSVRD